MKIITQSICLFTLFNFIKASITSTHWVVTKSDLIEPKLESPFKMANSNDLLAFLNQDSYWEFFVKLYHDLSHRKNVIDKIWADFEKSVDFDAKHVLNENCVKIGHLSSLNWYLTFVEEGKSMRIAHKEFLLHKPYKGKGKSVPKCKNLCSLEFSMSTFEHTESMLKRNNLKTDPETCVIGQISAEMNEDQFGHWVTNILQQNRSSWLHYNLASMYWRSKGNAPEAVECSRCSVYLAPRKYKDVALFNLGTLLHRCKMTNDAVMVLKSAIDHNPAYPIHHFIIGNAYTMLGSFQDALNHFDLCLKLHPSFVEAIKHKHGVFCLQYFLQELNKIQKLLKDLAEKLSEYQKLQSEWLIVQGAIIKSTKDWGEFEHATNRVVKVCDKMAVLSGFDTRALKKKGDKFLLILMLLQNKFNQEWFEKKKGVDVLEAARTLQFFYKQVEERSGSVS